jgi:F0F1-type ATP synthase assembly protein I
LKAKETTSVLRRRIVLAVYAIVSICAAAGFAFKLFEFSRSFLTGESSFALPGVTVYLMVACGFSAMFLWATLNGQFRDVEAPKRRLLDREAALDAGCWLSQEEYEQVEEKRA